MWFLIASIVDDKNHNPGLVRNWSSSLSFCFDRLLSGVNKLYIASVANLYRRNRELLDAYFEQTMQGFLTDLKFRPNDDKTQKTYDFGVPTTRKVAAGILNRLCETKAEHILLCLFHFRVMESYLGPCWIESQARTAVLRDSVSLNIQSVLGLYYVSSQLLLHPVDELKFGQGTRASFIYSDQLGISVDSIYSGIHSAEARDVFMQFRP